MEVANLKEKSSVAVWVDKTKNYVEELQAEMRRVTWPSWEAVRATTTVVIAAVFAFGAYFYVVDLAISRFINKIFATFAK